MNISINNTEIDTLELIHLINNGKKLMAIKRVKEQLNLGLKDCKDIIDNLERNPHYYDGKPHIIKSTIPEFAVEDKRQSRQPFVGKHIVKQNQNYKNYLILFLLLCIVVLAYIYYFQL